MRTKTFVSLLGVAIVTIAMIAPSASLAGRAPGFQIDYQSNPVMGQAGMPLWLEFMNVAAADTAGFQENEALGTTATTFTFTATESDAVLDFPRNITCSIQTPAQNDSAIVAGTITVTGIDVEGNTLTEEFTITEDTNESFTGSKAFRRLTSVAYPAQDDSSSGVTASIGIGSKIGFGITLPAACLLAYSSGGSLTMGWNTAPPTVATSMSAISSNTWADGTTPPNGANDYFILLWVPPIRALTATTKW